jgi:uncharacterized protein (TIGR02266 family)
MVNNAQPRSEAQFSEDPDVPESGENDQDAELARRLHTRYRVDLDVTVTSEHNFYAGFVENMSHGGLFIATHQLKPVGERLEFSVHLADCEEPIRGLGEVRWVRVFSESSNVPPGMGVRFIDLDDESTARIEEFLSKREPMFYDED